VPGSFLLVVSKKLENGCVLKRAEDSAWRMAPTRGNVIMGVMKVKAMQYVMCMRFKERANGKTVCGIMHAERIGSEIDGWMRKERGINAGHARQRGEGTGAANPGGTQQPADKEVFARQKVVAGIRVGRHRRKPEARNNAARLLGFWS
jgi:hypothetical protein